MQKIPVIYGPTAVGKSAYAIQLAHQHNGEIINCDARQVYTGMIIGTGAVQQHEQEGIPHHLLLFRDPATSYNVGEFLRDARQCEQDIRRRGRLPIYVGGTGLYVQTLLEGLSEGIRVDPLVRAQLEEQSLEDLVQQLLLVDPSTTIDLHNRRYVIRALEIYAATGSTRPPVVKSVEESPYAIIAITRKRGPLVERINVRHAEMFAQGLLEETAALMEQNVAEEVWKTIGYVQARAYLQGEISLDEAIQKTQAAARQYAKRQMTWLRRMEQRLPVRIMQGDQTAL